MYAIIRTGGKQYKVQAGDTVRVEKLEKTLGDTFNLSEVLMVGGDKTFLGSPLVSDAVVTVVVTRQAKMPKVVVFKKKRRQGYRRMHGHRQAYTELFVQSITSPEGQKGTTEKKAQIIDPVKSQARKDAAAAAKKQTKRSGSGKVESSDAAEVSAAPKKKAAKKTASKAGVKKTTSKKAPAKKAAAKKTTKKTAKKS